MPDKVLQAIRDFLRQAGVSYREIHHQPTFTSEESAAARGEDLCVGGKAILLKTDEVFRLFVLSAALKIDSAAVKRYFRVNKLRFATADELRERTGLVPGSVPPFGPPILPLELFVDPSVLNQTRIAFNAGSLTDSLVLSVPDYLRVANPTVFAFALPSPEPSEPGPPSCGTCDG
jgi:prolyl-tRNA editing enzyme YbaK/EbsC (Cys-tRNA(Pro) deacylase)